MAVGPETRAMVEKFRDATTKVGERIQRIIDNSDLTEEEKALAQVEIDRLTEMGNDPQNPVPPVPPVEPEPA